MKTVTKIIAVSILTLTVGGGAFAYSAHKHWQMNPDEKVEFITEKVTRKLDLDATQRQNFEVLANQLKDIMQEIRTSKQQQISQIEELLAEPVLDQARALNMITSKTQMVEEKAPQVIASMAGFLDSLNNEQKQQLQKFMKNRKRHHKKHGEFGES